MGKLAVYKYVSMMILVVQLIVTAYTFLGLFGGDVSPIGNSARAMVVYILPILIVLNLILLIYWLIRKKWMMAIIPALTIICCIPYMGTLVQFRSLDTKADTQKGLKIATYNVARFNRETTGFLAQDILAEMKRQSRYLLYSGVYGDHQFREKELLDIQRVFPLPCHGRQRCCHLQ